MLAGGGKRLLLLLLEQRQVLVRSIRQRRKGWIMIVRRLGRQRGRMECGRQVGNGSSSSSGGGGVMGAIQLLLVRVVVGDEGVGMRMVRRCGRDGLPLVHRAHRESSLIRCFSLPRGPGSVRRLGEERAKAAERGNVDHCESSSGLLADRLTCHHETCQFLRPRLEDLAIDALQRGGSERWWQR